MITLPMKWCVEGKGPVFETVKSKAKPNQIKNTLEKLNKGNFLSITLNSMVQIKKEDIWIVSVHLV